MAAKKKYTVTEVGIRTPKEISTKELDCGEVGYLDRDDQGHQGRFPGRDHHPDPVPRQPLCRATARSTRWSIAVFIRSIREITGS
jgi:hypothetical protein